MHTKVYSTTDFEDKDSITIIAAHIDSEGTLEYLDYVCKEYNKNLQPFLYNIRGVEEDSILAHKIDTLNPAAINNITIYANIDVETIFNLLFEIVECVYYKGKFYYENRDT